MTRPWTSALRERLIGALACLALLALLTVPAVLVPDGTPFAVPARILEAFVPYVLVGVLLLALLIVVLGARWLASTFVFGVLVVGLWFGDRHLQVTTSLDPAAAADLRIVFFNATSDNATHAGRIAAALITSGADVVVVAEPRAMLPHLEQLLRFFPHQFRCRHGCEMLFLSREPLEGGRFMAIFGARERYGQGIWRDPSGRAITIAGLHLTHPWVRTRAAPERVDLIRRLNEIEGPRIVVGDFNSPTWGRPMVEISRNTGLRALRWPFPTWPTQTLPFGIPIDHVLVSDDVRLVRVEPFGADLGSSHLGLLVDVALPSVR